MTATIKVLLATQPRGFHKNYSPTASFGLQKVIFCVVYTFDARVSPLGTGRSTWIDEELRRPS